MDTRFDVIVIGAGPAGASAAWHLAKHNLSVCLLEKETLPRVKTCGGGITGRAMQALPGTLPQHAGKECAVVAMNEMRAGLRFIVSRAQPAITMVQRPFFDQWLALQAAGAGACLLEKTPATKLQCSENHVEVHTRDQSFRAPWVIGADGAYGHTSQWAGWEKKPRLAPAINAEFTFPNGLPPSIEQQPRFDFGAVDHGYGWFFPKQKGCSIGLVSLAAKGANLSMNLKTYMGGLGMAISAMPQISGAAIPIGTIPGGCAKNRVILVGDAAGLADPLTCEGISNALLSGTIAAEAILQSKKDSHKAERIYAEILNRRIIKDLRASSFLAKIIYFHPKIREFLFARYGQRLCEAVTDILAGNRSFSRELYSFSNLCKLLTNR